MISAFFYEKRRKGRPFLRFSMKNAEKGALFFPQNVYMAYIWNKYYQFFTISDITILS